jgi:hypothetical protein
MQKTTSLRTKIRNDNDKIAQEARAHEAGEAIRLLSQRLALQNAMENKC